MATIDLLGGGSFAGSPLGNQLTDLLMCSDIQPGSAPSYQTCKALISFHPLARKMVYVPIRMAQSQQRDITVPNGPEQRVVQAFLDEWKRLRVDKKIAGLAGTSRTYGVGTLAVVVKDDADTEVPLDYKTLWTKNVGFNVLDPLNTSGSIATGNQDPNDIAFQNTADNVRVSGKLYHPSRTCVLLNEEPLYIEYSSSAFGYVGRSVFQRALFPLKSFVQSMRTDDLVVRKAGVIITKIKQVGSMVDNVMSKIVGQKRAIAKEAITDDVMSIGSEDAIESLNLMNLEGPYTLARGNIIDNLASASDMPAKILNSQTFAKGFGEGTEDAKDVARYIDSVREDMQPAYDFMDRIVQHRAWNPDFYKMIQEEFPDEYGGVDFDTAFYRWSNSFKAEWPSLLIEPESERAKVSDVKFRAAIAAAEVLLPVIDPDNKVKLVDWLCSTFNEQDILFPVRLDLDLDSLEDYVAKMVEQQEAMHQAGVDAAGEGGDEQEPKPPKPFSDALDNFTASVARLPERKKA